MKAEKIVEEQTKIIENAEFSYDSNSESSVTIESNTAKQAKIELEKAEKKLAHNKKAIKVFSLLIITLCPKCKSGAVGSTPSFILNFLPEESFFANSSISGRTTGRAIFLTVSERKWKEMSIRFQSRSKN